MIATQGFVLYSYGPDAVRAILAAPVECRCGRMAAFVVNRDGQTRCVECDENYKREREAACSIS